MMEKIALVLAVVFLLVIQFFNKQVLKKNYKVINPVSLMVYEWALLLLLHAAVYEYHSYTLTTYAVSVIGVIFFALGFWTCCNKNIKIKQIGIEANEYNDNTLHKYMKIFTVLNVLRMSVYIYIIYSLAGSFSVFLKQNTYVRNLYLSRQTTLFTYLIELPLSIISMVGFIFLGVYVARKNKGRIVMLLIWTIIETLIAYTTMSKQNLFIFVFVVGYTILNNIGNVKIQRKIIKRFAPLIGIALFAFLVLIARQRNYQFEESFFRQTVERGIHYFTCAFEAFGFYLERYAENSNVVLSSVNVGGGSLTNVFTWYRSFITYFSYFGIVIGPFIVGALAGIYYNLPRKSISVECARSWIGCVIFMSFYAFLWTHHSYLFGIILAYILDTILFKKLYSNSIIDHS